MLVASAVKLSDGRIFTGKRHNDCFALIMENGISKEECRGHIQGFVDGRFQFLTRSQALAEAIRCRQLKREVQGELSSEDLW